MIKIMLIKNELSKDEKDFFEKMNPGFSVKGDVLCLDLEKLYTLPAKLEEIPLYVKQEDTAGNIHIYVYEHASLTNGYVKKNALCVPVPYKGNFGVGFTVNLHNNISTRYALKAYYVEVPHSVICSANDNCTLCPLYSANGTEEQCYY